MMNNVTPLVTLNTNNGSSKSSSSVASTTTAAAVAVSRQSSAFAEKSTVMPSGEQNGRGRGGITGSYTALQSSPSPPSLVMEDGRAGHPHYHYHEHVIGAASPSAPPLYSDRPTAPLAARRRQTVRRVVAPTPSSSLALPTKQFGCFLSRFPFHIDVDLFKYFFIRGINTRRAAEGMGALRRLRQEVEAILSHLKGISEVELAKLESLSEYIDLIINTTRENEEEECGDSGGGADGEKGERGVALDALRAFLYHQTIPLGHTMGLSSSPDMAGRRGPSISSSTTVNNSGGSNKTTRTPNNNGNNSSVQRRAAHKTTLGFYERLAPDWDDYDGCPSSIDLTRGNTTRVYGNGGHDGNNEEHEGEHNYHKHNYQQQQQQQQQQPMSIIMARSEALHEEVVDNYRVMDALCGRQEGDSALSGGGGEGGHHHHHEDEHHHHTAKKSSSSSNKNQQQQDYYSAGLQRPQAFVASQSSMLPIPQDVKKKMVETYYAVEDELVARWFGERDDKADRLDYMRGYSSDDSSDREFDAKEEDGNDQLVSSASEDWSGDDDADEDEESPYYNRNNNAGGGGRRHNNNNNNKPNAIPYFSGKYITPNLIDEVREDETVAATMRRTTLCLTPLLPSSHNAKSILSPTTGAVGATAAAQSFSHSSAALPSSSSSSSAAGATILASIPAWMDRVEAMRSTDSAANSNLRRTNSTYSSVGGGAGGGGKGSPSSSNQTTYFRNAEKNRILMAHNARRVRLLERQRVVVELMEKTLATVVEAIVPTSDLDLPIPSASTASSSSTTEYIKQLNVLLVPLMVVAGKKQQRDGGAPPQGGHGRAVGGKKKYLCAAAREELEGFGASTNSRGMLSTAIAHFKTLQRNLQRISEDQIEENFMASLLVSAYGTKRSRGYHRSRQWGNLRRVAKQMLNGYKIREKTFIPHTVPLSLAISHTFLLPTASNPLLPSRYSAFAFGYIHRLTTPLLSRGYGHPRLTIGWVAVTPDGTTLQPKELHATHHYNAAGAATQQQQQQQQGGGFKKITTLRTVFDGDLNNVVPDATAIAFVESIVDLHVMPSPDAFINPNRSITSSSPSLSVPHDHHHRHALGSDFILLKVFQPLALFFGNVAEELCAAVSVIAAAWCNQSSLLLKEALVDGCDVVKDKVLKMQLLQPHPVQWQVHQHVGLQKVLMLLVGPSAANAVILQQKTTAAAAAAMGSSGGGNGSPFPTSPLTSSPPSTTTQSYHRHYAFPRELEASHALSFVELMQFVTLCEQQQKALAQNNQYHPSLLTSPSLSIAGAHALSSTLAAVARIAQLLSTAPCASSANARMGVTQVHGGKSNALSDALTVMVEKLLQPLLHAVSIRTCHDPAHFQPFSLNTAASSAPSMLWCGNAIVATSYTPAYSSSSSSKGGGEGNIAWPDIGGTLVAQWLCELQAMGKFIRKLRGIAADADRDGGLFATTTSAGGAGGGGSPHHSRNGITDQQQQSLAKGAWCDVCDVLMTFASLHAAKACEYM